MPALAIFRFARSRRWPIVFSVVRKRRPIAAVEHVRPRPSASGPHERPSPMPGWQQVNIEPQPIVLDRSPSGRAVVARSSCMARSASFARSVSLRRSTSMARRRAVVVNQAAGLSGIPSARPAFERPLGGVGDSILGDLPVARRADQRGDDTQSFGGQRGGERLVNVVGVVPWRSSRRRVVAVRRCRRDAVRGVRSEPSGAARRSRSLRRGRRIRGCRIRRSTPGSRRMARR